MDQRLADLDAKMADVKAQIAALRRTSGANAEAAEMKRRAQAANRLNPYAPTSDADFVGLPKVAADYSQRLEALKAQYNRHVERYNAVVLEIRREKQANANARKAAQTHAAACGRCFTVHPGEC